MSSLRVRVHRADPSRTVSDLFEAVVVPRQKEQKVSAGHLSEQRKHLERWREFWRSENVSPSESSTRLQYPCVQPSSPAATDVAARDVEEEDLLAFRQWLPEQQNLFPKGVSNRTLNKHVQTIRSVLDAVKVAVRITPLPEAVAPKYYFSIDQLNALYNAADAAQWPVEGLGDLVPGDFWRTAFVWYYNFGFRTQELVAFEKDHQPLRLRDFTFGPMTPDPAGEAECEHGWFSYVPQKQRRKKPGPLYLPINRVAYAHAELVFAARFGVTGERFRSFRNVETYHQWLRDRELVNAPFLPVPQCNRSFYRAWNQILERAKVRPKASLDESVKFDLQHFRKTNTTWLNKHRRGIAPYVTGHASRDTASKVSDRHYDNVGESLVEALTTFPQPDAFLKVFQARQQRTLF